MLDIQEYWSTSAFFFWKAKIIEFYSQLCDAKKVFSLTMVTYNFPWLCYHFVGFKT